MSGRAPMTSPAGAGSFDSAGFARSAQDDIRPCHPERGAEGLADPCHAERRAEGPGTPYHPERRAEGPESKDPPRGPASPSAPALPAVPEYAASVADYGPSAPRGADGGPFQGALVTAVRPESPADDAGIEPGMRVTHVNGALLTDMIVWLWEADDETVELTVHDPSDGTDAVAELERYPGEDWGLTFNDAIFDEMRTCVNACVFCFMTMLPKGSRKTLSIRDDDYRLSFLQGNFVTLTNMSDADVENVIEKDLSPMNVSIHAVSPGVRRRIIGRNAARGMVVLERLMAAGIEIHAQIVLCPGLNDGGELARTLEYCEAHEQVTSLGIVPLGFTKHQKRFTASYSDDPASARAVIEQVRPYQERAYARLGRHTFQMSDEFYLCARIDPPEASFYDGYPQYYDGIGMIRSYLDDAAELLSAGQSRLEVVAARLRARGLALWAVSGEGARGTVARLIEAEPLAGRVAAIKNRYFGGNVNVTGLICACDLLDQLPDDLSGVMLIVPSVMFNADGLTLDGYDRERLLRDLEGRGAEAHAVSTMPRELIGFLEGALGIA